MLRSISIALSLLVAPVSLAQAPTTARPQVPAPPSPRATEVPDLTLERLWPEIKFVRPIQMIQVPDQPNLWWAAEQPGTIRLLDMTAQDAKEAPLVVDLTEPVNDPARFDQHRTPYWFGRKAPPPESHWGRAHRT